LRAGDRVIGAGNLRDRITIRRQVNLKNPETGGLERSWETLATVWAEVKAINGREAVIGNTLQGISTFQVTIRWRGDVKASDQLLWPNGGTARELNVLTAEDRFGTHKWTTIIADTQAAQGA
jgi:SPP1 family predicted phage head-tail adaptor